ncbi:MAG TPA: hypothetical protein VM692_10335 [Gammaproteobacteria bacterium]|nr:hypothetical protein [Gammaproteobacteria bacterium]
MKIGAATAAALLAVIATAASAAGTRSDLDGVWLFYASQVPDDPGLTPAGRAKLEQYDPLRDDADTDCKPVTFTNIMHTPSPPIEIRLHEADVEINYEFMDVHRRVPLNGTLATAPLTVARHQHMGRSLGRYEGDELVVETVDVEAGYLDTLGFAGLPQSAQMRTEERFIPDGDRLKVVVTHHDPVYYTSPMVMTYDFVRVDTKIMEWGCTLEGANYLERLKDAEAK